MQLPNYQVIKFTWNIWKIDKKKQKNTWSYQITKLLGISYNLLCCASEKNLERGTLTKLELPNYQITKLQSYLVYLYFFCKGNLGRIFERGTPSDVELPNYQITKLPSYPVNIKNLVHWLWKRKLSKGAPYKIGPTKLLCISDIFCNGYLRNFLYLYISIICFARGNSVDP